MKGNRLINRLKPVTLGCLLAASLTVSANEDPLPGLTLAKQNQDLDNLDFKVGDAFTVKTVNLSVDYDFIDGTDTWSIYGTAKVEIDSKSNESDEGGGGDANLARAYALPLRRVASLDDESASSNDDANPCEAPDGSSNMAEDSDGNGVIEIEADFGDSDNPGIVVNGTELESVNIGLAGSFEIGKLVVCVDDDNPVTVQYSKPEDTFELSGEVFTKELWQASVELGTAEQPGIKIDKGSFKLDDLTIDVQDVDAGGLTMKNIEIAFKTLDDGSFDFDVSLDIAFPPDGFEVAGDVEFTDGKLSGLGIDFSTSGDEQGIEIGDTGVAIAELGVSVQNLQQPGDLTFTGTVGLEFGGQVEIEGQELTVIRSNGKVTLNHHSLVISDTVFLGAYQQNQAWQSVLGTGTAKIDLDWGSKTYSLDGSLEIPNDPGVSVDASLVLNNGSFYFNGDAKLEVPKEVPIIGGWVVDEVGAAMQSVKGQPDQSFGAGWTKVVFATVGAEYNFGIKKFKLIGGKTVDDIKQTVSQNEQNALKTDIAKSFDIPSGVESMIIKITLTQDSSDNPTGTDELVLPDATLLLVNEGAEGSIFMGLTEVSNADGKVNAAQASVPIGGGLVNEVIVAGTSPVELTYHVTVLPEYQKIGIQEGTGEIVFSYVTSLAPSLTMDLEASMHYPTPTITAAPSTQSNDVTQLLKLKSMRYAQTGDSSLDLQYWTHGSLSDGAKIHLYVDDDDQGYDGRQIARDLNYGTHDPQTGGAQRVDWQGPTWKPTTNHPYYFYAVIEDGTNVPTYSDYSAAILRSPPIVGEVRDPLQNDAAVAHVRLYLDINGNGRYDQGIEPVELTNTDGQYAFHQVPEGARSIGLILSSAYQLDELQSVNTLLTPILPSSNVQRFDYAVNKLAEITGVVFDDVNDNGIWDADEASLPDIRVYSDENANGVFDAEEMNVVTNAQGVYRVAGLDAGAVYRMRADLDNAPIAKVAIPATAFEQFSNINIGILPDSAVILPRTPDTQQSSSSGSANLWLIFWLCVCIASRQRSRR